MRSGLLKRIRIFFAVVFIMATAFVFIDFRDILPDSYTGTILYLQFVPSLIKYITLPSVAAAGFAVILILTLLTGRTYCSAICPLGIIQDAGSRLGGLIRRRFRRFGYGKPYTIIRYGILVITILVTITGGIYMVSLLDPYSIFGRFTTYFLKPVVLLLNNAIAGILNRGDIYSLYRIDIKGVTIAAYIIPVVFFLLVAAMSVMKGRLYCNTICPAGTLLGLISKVSVLRINIDHSGCTRCGRCALACKASCIDFHGRDIDNSRCVGCFNCITACREKAISYGLYRGRLQSDGYVPDEGKRSFTVGLLFLLAGIGDAARGRDVPVPKKQSTVREKKNLPVCLPGATSIENFLSRCTACSLCISACPKNVIHPSIAEYGIAGIMQPRMDYHRGFCNFECTICTEICPTGALMPLATEAKKLTQLGVARFIKENCIVHTEKTDCGACSEHCPTKAVEM
ncbi:MAG: 4Fe-4S binding protein, partial [Bacteroidetes bacterium]|nr:4Fe-4S binding protein [Bacteroidota bacterium]